jgi:hypothetical protein
MSAELYHGGCQCGAVRFSVRLDLEKPGATCNCSRCRRLGWILHFAPRADFTLETGEGALTEFRFNREKIAHLFCKTCGIECFSFAERPDGTPTVAVNARTLDGVDATKLETTFFDGASM